MADLTALIEEARNSFALIGDGDWTPQDKLGTRLLEALTLVAARAEQAEQKLDRVREWWHREGAWDPDALTTILDGEAKSR